MHITNKQIKKAAQDFRKALEASGKKDVVFIYSYRGVSENTQQEAFFSSHVSENFMQVIATCELVKHDILSGTEDDDEE